MRPFDIIKKIEKIERNKEIRASSAIQKVRKDEIRAATNTLSETKFGFPIFVVERNNAQNINQSGVVKDPIRELAGAFWTTKLDAIGDVYYPINSEDTSKFVDFIKDEELSQKTISPEGNLVFEEHYDFLEEDPDIVEKIFELTENLSTKTNYTDHCCVFYTLSDENNISKESPSPHLYAKVKADYNFYHEFYEPSSNQFSEKSLPNLYAFYEAENVVERPELKNFLTLDGRIKFSKANSIFYERGEDLKKNFRVRPVGQYLNNWSLYSYDWSSSDSYQTQINKFKNIIFSHKDVSKFESINKNKQVFPMFVDLEFTTSSNSVATSFLSEAGIISELQQDVVKALNDDTMKTLETFEAQTTSKGSIRTRRGRLVLGYNTEVKFDKKRIFNFIEWIKSFKETRRSQIANMIVMNQGDEIIRDEQSEFFYNLMELITKGKFNNFMHQYARSYSDILAGKKCYNEAVFYRVDKHVGSEQEDDLNLEPVQSFYFSNLEEAKKITLADTQVKYGESYTYKIYVYNLIIGSQYKVQLTDLSRIPTDRGRIDPETGNSVPITTAIGSVKIKSFPTMNLMEVEIFQKHVVIMDNPSVAPEVEIIPFRGIEDKIRIFLTSGVGSYDLHPIPIEESEADEITKLRIAQDLEDDEKIRFESDDAARSFTVYRMETKPKSYQDFEESLIREISTGGYPSVALDDKIKPNRKYYYCFKSVDIHDHYSYPSFIYEVELVSDAGSVYPLIRTIDFDLSASKEPTKPLKRLIHIKPSTLQMEVDEVASGIENATTIEKERPISLGVLEHKVWGKNFKVRLTSKSSGKKVDFNFNFDYNVEKQRT